RSVLAVLVRLHARRRVVVEPMRLFGLAAALQLALDQEPFELVRQLVGAPEQEGVVRIGIDDQCCLHATTDATPPAGNCQGWRPLLVPFRDSRRPGDTDRGG